MPLQGISTGKRSAACRVSTSSSRLFASPCPGKLEKKNRFCASVSGMPRAPFIRVMACSTLCRRSARMRSACSASMRLRAGREVRIAMVRLIWQDFSELEIRSCKTLIS